MYVIETGMHPCRVLLLDCAPCATGSLEFRNLLAACLGEEVHLKRESLEAERDPASIWGLAAKFDPALVFLLGNSESLPRISDVLRAPRGAIRFPIVAAIDDIQPAEIWEFLRLGVDDFFTPPWRSAELLPRVWRLVGQGKKEETGGRSPADRGRLSEFVGHNAQLLALLDQLPLVAAHDVAVLVQGETGTGKDLVAKAVHRLSPRASKPFVAVNCGALPAELVENELFGHEAGAFTGAGGAKAGLLAQAQGGTFFLDEIASLPLPAQVKLLRFLQTREFRSLGAGQVQKIDVRIIAASNTDMEQAVRDGKFRADLYYRLNIIPFTMPPLRDRREDIPLLAHHFLQKYASAFEKPMAGFQPEALAKLMDYSWPGNLRELENTIERAVVLTREHRIQQTDISLPNSGGAPACSFQEKKARMIANFEQTLISELLAASNGNITHASKQAGKNRRAFLQLIRRYRIDPHRFKVGAAHSRAPDKPSPLADNFDRGLRQR